tara:strand:- start:12615 stop:14084 length:1470 start_codon:yes stop_codon:yes gene_type:complete
LNNKRFNLSNYYHDRSEKVENSVFKLYSFIENVGELDAIQNWYHDINKRLDLPNKVICHYFKKYLSDNFSYLSNKGFGKKFFIKSIPGSLIKYFLFVSYIFFKRKKYNVDKNSYELMIDNIEWQGDLDRYKKLINLFKKDSVLVITTVQEKVNLKGTATKFKPNYINYFLTINELIGLFHLGINILIASLMSRINLFGISIQIINSYYYNYSLFKENKSNYLINHQHYHTDAIKNHLFKKMGGLASAIIQKNIHQQGHNGFYYDADIFFAIGKKTGERPKKYGARFGTVTPIGSFFMEYHYFKQKKSLEEIPTYDVLCLGYNVGEFQNIYDKYYDDYYEHFEWLVRLNDAHPKLKIGIAHHANNIDDPIEKKIIAGTNIERINPKIDSYSLGFKSGVNVTYGSSMGYEFIGHNRPCVFMDPGYRNTQYLPDGDELKELRASSFNEFHELILSILSKKNKSLDLNNNDLCLYSKDVSEKIHHNLFNSGKL